METLPPVSIISDDLEVNGFAWIESAAVNENGCVSLLFGYSLDIIQTGKAAFRSLAKSPVRVFERYYDAVLPAVFQESGCEILGQIGESLLQGESLKLCQNLVLIVQQCYVSLADRLAALCPGDKNGITARETAIMAHDYTRRTATDDARWVFLPGLGRGKGNMGIEPVTAKSRPLGDGATLEYDINFSQSGKQKLALGILPTNDVNPARGLRIGVRVDDGEMQTIDARQGYVDTFNEYTKENIARSKVLKPLPRPASDIYLSGSRQRMRSEIFDNLRWLSIDFDIPTAGNHTVKVVMIDPEIVVEKLVINPDNEHPSYHGKE